MSRKPWTLRILLAATREPIIDRTVIRRRFKLAKCRVNSRSLNIGPGRSLSYLNELGYLKRVDKGQYKITPKGKRFLIDNTINVHY